MPAAVTLHNSSEGKHNTNVFQTANVSLSHAGKERGGKKDWTLMCAEIYLENVVFSEETGHRDCVLCVT